MHRQVFFDFDGTLVDNRRRLYELIVELVPQLPLSFDEYWSVRRNYLNQRELLLSQTNLPAAEIENIGRLWLEQIEAPERLALDIPFPGVDKLLRELSHRRRLHLITARQHPERVIAQLKTLRLLDYFESVLVTSQRTSKADLILSSLKHAPDDTIIGDTVEDIKAGKKLGIRTIAVLSGAMDSKRLGQCQPDHIYESVVAALPAL